MGGCGEGGKGEIQSWVMRESELLRHIFAGNRFLPGTVTIGPGDDMGAVRVGSEEVLIAVDQVVEGVHFPADRTPMRKVGRKALTRNLSDVAAMGAVPVAAVAAVCLPKDLAETAVMELVDGLQAAGREFGCPLVGGDIAVWSGRLVVSLTVLAEMRGIQPVLRCGARAGDLIFVSGELGGSLEETDGYVHHLDFQPRLALGRKLAESPVYRPTAMIDISDGLVRDLGHICEGSGLRAVVDVERLPISPRAHRRAGESGRPAWEHALADGEDYELCFTVSAEAARHVPEVLEGIALRCIGKMEPATEDQKPGVTLRMPDGSLQRVEGWGWEHSSESE